MVSAGLTVLLALATPLPTVTNALAASGAAPPALSAAFGASRVGLDGTTTLTFTLTNPNSSVPLTGIAFSDALPSGLVIEGPAGAGDTCGGNLDASAGSSYLALSEGQVAPGASCAISETLAATATGTLTDTTTPVGSNEGGTGTPASASIAVVGAPSISLSSPVGGHVYPFGQKVRASYSCVDDPGGSGISSCSGTVPSGSLIDTGTAGTHTFTITATSSDGGTASDLLFYTVAPNNRFKLGARHVHGDGSIDFTVTLPGPGRVNVTETMSGGRLMFARAQATARRATTLHITVRPNAQGRQAVQGRRGLRVSGAVGYTPKGGTRRVVQFTFDTAA